MPALKPIFNYLAKHLSTYFDPCYSSKHFRTCLCATWTGWKRCLSVCWIGKVYKVRTLRESCLNTMIRDSRKCPPLSALQRLETRVGYIAMLMPPSASPHMLWAYFTHGLQLVLLENWFLYVCLCNFSVTSLACLTLQSFSEAISHAVWCRNKSPWS